MPPPVAYRVGGSGARARHAARFLPAVRGAVAGGRPSVLPVAGSRPGVAAAFERWTREAGLGAPGVEILFAPRTADDLEGFHSRPGEVDVPWTKPSEPCSFAALGLPLLPAEPPGAHGARHRALAIALGAGVVAPAPENVPAFLEARLADGALAAAAMAGFRRLPRDGTYRILHEIGVAPLGYRVGTTDGIRPATKPVGCVARRLWPERGHRAPRSLPPGFSRGLGPRHWFRHGASPVGLPDRTLDDILFSRHREVEEYRVLRDFHLSDHYPVEGEFHLVR